MVTKARSIILTFFTEFPFHIRARQNRKLFKDKANQCQYQDQWKIVEADQIISLILFHTTFLAWNKTHIYRLI